jgi:hypothetical protein
MVGRKANNKALHGVLNGKWYQVNHGSGYHQHLAEPQTLTGTTKSAKMTESALANSHSHHRSHACSRGGSCSVSENHAGRGEGALCFTPEAFRLKVQAQGGTIARDDDMERFMT